MSFKNIKINKFLRLRPCKMLEGHWEDRKMNQILVDDNFNNMPGGLSRKKQNIDTMKIKLCGLTT